MQTFSWLILRIGFLVLDHIVQHPAGLFVTLAIVCKFFSVTASDQPC
jgi:hypothetical protein